MEPIFRGDVVEIEPPSNRPKRLNKATLTARQEREQALNTACAAVWGGILEHAADWLYAQLDGGLALRRLVASNDVLAEGHQLADTAAARLRVDLRDAAKDAPWIQTATFFYPLVAGATLPPSLDRLGQLVADALPAVMACAQLPARDGANPFRNESWPGGRVQSVEMTNYAAGGAHGGLIESVKSTRTEQRFVRHPIHALFDACVAAASQFTREDVAAALSGS